MGHMQIALLALTLALAGCGGVEQLVKECNEGKLTSCEAACEKGNASSCKNAGKRHEAAEEYERAEAFYAKGCKHLGLPVCVDIDEVRKVRERRARMKREQADEAR